MAPFGNRDGNWQARVQRKGQQAGSKLFHSKEDTQRWARQIEAEIDKGSYTNTALANSTDKRMIVEAAVSEIANSLIATPSNKRNNSARQLLGSLIACGFLSSELVNDEGWIWLS